VTEHNAHPHLDCVGRLALIHNGIVSNYRELREPLVRAGHRFRSETDTEVVAHLLEECLAATPAGPEQLVAATMAAFRRLQGLNAVAVADVRTGQIAAAKSGSPLVLGWGERGHLLASDFSALLERATRSAGTARNWKAKKQRRYLVTKRPYYPSMAEITEAFKWLADRGCWRRRRIVARTTATDIVLERACTLMRERIVHDGDVGPGVY